MALFAFIFNLAKILMLAKLLKSVMFIVDFKLNKCFERQYLKRGFFISLNLTYDNFQYLHFDEHFIRNEI